MSVVPDMASARSNLEGQLYAITSIPTQVLTKWPVVVTFAIVNTASSYVINALSGMTYVNGQVGSALVKGLAQVITLSTWDVAKNAHVGSLLMSS